MGSEEIFAGSIPALHPFNLTSDPLSIQFVVDKRLQFLRTTAEGFLSGRV